MATKCLGHCLPDHFSARSRGHGGNSLTVLLQNNREPSQNPTSISSCGVARGRYGWTRLSWWSFPIRKKPRNDDAHATLTASLPLQYGRTLHPAEPRDRQLRFAPGAVAPAADCRPASGARLEDGHVHLRNRRQGLRLRAAGCLLVTPDNYPSDMGAHPADGVFQILFQKFLEENSRTALIFFFAHVNFRIKSENRSVS